MQIEVATWYDSLVGFVALRFVHCSSIWIEFVLILWYVLFPFAFLVFGLFELDDKICRWWFSYIGFVILDLRSYNYFWICQLIILAIDFRLYVHDDFWLVQFEYIWFLGIHGFVFTAPWISCFESRLRIDFGWYCIRTWCWFSFITVTFASGHLLWPMAFWFITSAFSSFTVVFMFSLVVHLVMLLEWLPLVHFPYWLDSLHVLSFNCARALSIVVQFTRCSTWSCTLFFAASIMYAFAYCCCLNIVGCHLHVLDIVACLWLNLYASYMHCALTWVWFFTWNCTSCLLSCSCARALCILHVCIWVVCVSCL